MINRKQKTKLNPPFQLMARCRQSRDLTKNPKYRAQIKSTGAQKGTEWSKFTTADHKKIGSPVRNPVHNV